MLNYIHKEKNDVVKRGKFLVIVRYRFVFGTERRKNETKKSRLELTMSERACD